MTEPAPRPRDGLERLSHAFGVLFPMIVALIGVAMVVACLIVPSLRNPALIGAMAGLLSVAGTVGLARRESR